MPDDIRSNIEEAMRHKRCHNETSVSKMSRGAEEAERRQATDLNVIDDDELPACSHWTTDHASKSTTLAALLPSYSQVIASTKELMFYPVFVYLSVSCMLATSCKNDRLQLRETFTGDVCLDNEELIKCRNLDPGIFRKILQHCNMGIFPQFGSCLLEKVIGSS